MYSFFFLFDFFRFVSLFGFFFFYLISVNIEWWYLANQLSNHLKSKNVRLYIHVFYYYFLIMQSPWTTQEVTSLWL